MRTATQRRFLESRNTELFIVHRLNGILFYGKFMLTSNQNQTCFQDWFISIGLFSHRIFILFGLKKIFYKKTLYEKNAHYFLIFSFINFLFESYIKHFHYKLYIFSCIKY